MTPGTYWMWKTEGLVDMKVAYDRIHTILDFHTKLLFMEGGAPGHCEECAGVRRARRRSVTPGTGSNGH